MDSGNKEEKPVKKWGRRFARPAGLYLPPLPAGENASETSTPHNSHITRQSTSSASHDPLILNELQDSITGIETKPQNLSLPSSPTRGDQSLPPVAKALLRPPKKRHAPDRIASVSKRRAQGQSPKASTHLKTQYDAPTPGAYSMANPPPPPNYPTETHSPMPESPHSSATPTSAPTPGARPQQTPPADLPSTPPRNLALQDYEYVTPSPWADQYPYNQQSDSDSSPEIIPLSEAFVPVSVELEDPFIDHDNPPVINRGLDKMDEGL
ncbi:hypothetical protein FQN54_009432 [Arachnomyces sp. PD_36]|nr:hypothetical protein FQN54_009432 [Arachnomyces sp. PD_36]